MLRTAGCRSAEPSPFLVWRWPQVCLSALGVIFSSVAAEEHQSRTGKGLLGLRPQ